MANVTFINALNNDAHLHMRIGSIDVHPDERGIKNDVIKKGESADYNVDDGDVWFCFGNQMVNSAQNPELCNAVGGSTVTLNATKPCYVQN